jgi:plasmid stability protein
MATMTIHNLDDGLKLRLRVRAAMHGRSMEEDAREILRQAVGEADLPLNLAAAIRARIADPDRAELDLPEREEMRAPSPLGTQQTSRRAGFR